jgi:hypothetical protein
MKARDVPMLYGIFSKDSNFRDNLGLGFVVVVSFAYITMALIDI